MWELAKYLSGTIGACIFLCIGLLLNGIEFDNIFFIAIVGIGYGAGFLLFWCVVIAALGWWNTEQEKIRARILVEALEEYKKGQQNGKDKDNPI